MTIPFIELELSDTNCVRQVTNVSRGHVLLRTILTRLWSSGNYPGLQDMARTFEVLQAGMAYQWYAPVVCTSTGYELQPVWVNVCVRSKFDKGYVLRSTHCETAAVRPQDIPRCGRPAPGLAPTQHLCIVFQSRVRVLDVIRNAHSAAYVFCFHRVLKYWAGCGWKKVNFREEMDQRLPQPMIMPIAFPHLRLLWWKKEKLCKDTLHIWVSISNQTIYFTLSMGPLNNLILI